MHLKKSVSLKNFTNFLKEMHFYLGKINYNNLIILMLLIKFI
jgi:hypothetical protein